MAGAEGLESIPDVDELAAGIEPRAALQVVGERALPHTAGGSRREIAGG
jgi:hypothetical protein